jgi:uncharacterized membrane protein
MSHLFEHNLHPHKPTNVNFTHAREQAEGGFNMCVAIGMTKVFQAMPTFWAIFAWIVLWIIGNATILHFDPVPWPLLLCLASVPQLPLMVVIMVGQGLLGRHQELQSDEAYRTATKTFYDVERIMDVLATQSKQIEQLDEEMRVQYQLLLNIFERVEVKPAARRRGNNGDNGTTAAH